MALSQQQIDALGAAISGIAAVFVPAEAAAVAGLVNLATELNGVIHGIRTNDPALWAQVVAMNADAESKWTASVAAHPGT